MFIVSVQGGGIKTSVTKCNLNDLDPLTLVPLGEIPPEYRIRFVQNGVVFCFDREALHRWVLQGKPTNPMTNTPLPPNVLQELLHSRTRRPARVM